VPDVSAHSFTGRRALLAEDDASARRVLARSLRDMGFDVTEVEDGGRMLVAITSHYKDGRTPDDLDLIVTDVNMPIMSGTDAFKGLRAAHWRTPIIVVTGDETAQVRDIVDRLGATVLFKPLDLDVFEATVRELVARRLGS
jgi:DNA-binding response OmpR family regulator